MQLYKWQKEGLRAWEDNEYRGIVNVVTGAGKTVFAMAALDLLLICDECHHYQSPENRKIFSFIQDLGERENLYHSIGLSATPFGTPNDNVLMPETQCCRRNRLLRYRNASLRDLRAQIHCCRIRSRKET